MATYMAVLYLIGGIVLLFIGGETLISGAKKLAASFGVTPLLIGLTVVAFGTSAPELSVSVNAVLSGATDISLGNVIGSNTCNILLILGLCSLIAPLAVHETLVKIDVPVMVVASLTLALVSLDLLVTRAEGSILLLFFFLYLALLLYLAKKGHKALEEDDVVREKKYFFNIILIVAGLLGLVAGASILVEGASELARSFGVSERTIGLTLVAAGTSLPELITSLVATYRGERDIAVGNIVGSNIFNTFFVLSISAIVAPLPMQEAMLYQDLPVMLAASLCCIPIMLDKKISRVEGGFLLLGYFGYVFFLLAAQ